MVDYSCKPNSEPTSKLLSDSNPGSSHELGMQFSAKPQLEAFANVERTYSRGDWSEALDAGQALLANMQVGATNSLRLRLELLIGHTLLYGLGKQAEAEPHYRVVQQRSGDPVLLAITSQCLQLCSGFAADFPPQDGSGEAAGAASDLPAVFQPLPSALAAALEPAGSSQLSPALEPGSHAKPWLQHTAGGNYPAASTTPANNRAASATGTDLEFSPATFATAEFSNYEPRNPELANAEFDNNELDGSHFDGAAFPGIGGAGADLFPCQDSQDVRAFNPATTNAAPATADELVAVPAPVRLKVTVASPWAAGDQAQPALSAAEMAELAKGLLELVLE